MARRRSERSVEIIHQPARSSGMARVSRGIVTVPMICEKCGERYESGDGCLPWKWGRFEMTHSNGFRRRIYLCRGCVLTSVPDLLRESARSIASVVACGVCKRHKPRIGIDRELPEGWMRLEVVIDAQIVFAGGEQGCRMYFCPTCGPFKLPPLLESLTKPGEPS